VTHAEVTYETRIPLYQWEMRENVADAIGNDHGTSWPFHSERHEHWGPTGRWLIGAWLASLELDRSDVVTILTTSQEQYVSICVSVMAFNHATISRVIKDRTRVIIVIHEFGYVDTTLPGRIAEWRQHGMLVLEDCAFLAGLKVGSGWAGDFGDAALFSLPKIIPAEAGGLLRTRAPFRLPPMDQAKRAATAASKSVADSYLPYVDRFNELRMERHGLLRGGLGLPPWEPAAAVTGVPFFSMYTDYRQDVYKAAFPNVFWGTASLVPGRLQVPTNPLVPLRAFETVTDHVRSVVDAWEPA
jgi:DegT/DnrJ/EryC1/StrS aminotransferase family